MHIQFYTATERLEELLGFVRLAMELSYGAAYSAAAMEMFREYHSDETVMADVAAGGVLTAREGGRIIGTVTLAGGEIGRIFVSPEHQGMGIGRALMERALEHCRAQGWPVITAWAVPWARGFYERFGFGCVNADTLDFHNTRQIAVPYYEMQLRPQASPVQVLPIGPADAEELLRSQRLAFREQGQLYGDWSIPPLTETVQDVLAALEGGAIALKAVADGRIIGGVRGKLVGSTAHIGRLFVLPQAQRGGVARRLMAAIEEALSSCGNYALFTGERSHGNLALYGRQGYALTGRSETAQPAGGTPYRLVWLEKPSPWPHIHECIGRYTAR